MDRILIHKSRNPRGLRLLFCAYHQLATDPELESGTTCIILPSIFNKKTPYLPSTRYLT